MMVEVYEEEEDEEGMKTGGGGCTDPMQRRLLLLLFRMLLLRFRSSKERLLAFPILHKHTFITDGPSSSGNEGDDERMDDEDAALIRSGRRRSSTATYEAHENQNNNGRTTNGNGDLFHMEARENHGKRRMNQEEEMTVNSNERGRKQDCRECRCCGGRITTREEGGGGRVGGRGGGGRVRDVSQIKSDIKAGAARLCLKETVRTEEAVRADGGRGGGGGGGCARRQRTNIAQHQQQQQQQHTARQQKKINATSTSKIGGKQSKQTDENIISINDSGSRLYERPSSPASCSSSPRLSKAAWLSGGTSLSYHASVLESSKAKSKRLTEVPNLSHRAADETMAIHDSTSRNRNDWSQVAEFKLAKHSILSNHSKGGGGGGSTSNLSAFSAASCQPQRGSKNSYAERLRKRRNCLTQQLDSSSIDQNTNDSTTTSAFRTNLCPTEITQRDGKPFSKSLPPQSLYALSGSVSMDHNGDTVSESVKSINSTSMCFKGVRTIPAYRRLQSHVEPTCTKSLGGQWNDKAQQKEAAKAANERPSALPWHLRHIQGATALQAGEAKRQVTRPVQDTAARDHFGGGGGGGGMWVPTAKNATNGISIERRTAEKPCNNSGRRRCSLLSSP